MRKAIATLLFMLTILSCSTDNNIDGIGSFATYDAGTRTSNLPSSYETYYWYHDKKVKLTVDSERFYVLEAIVDTCSQDKYNQWNSFLEDELKWEGSKNIDIKWSIVDCQTLKNKKNIFYLRFTSMKITTKYTYLICSMLSLKRKRIMTS